MIRAHVILSNADGEQAREEISIDESKTDDVDGAVDDAISHVLDGLAFSIGDTISIVAVDRAADRRRRLAEQRRRREQARSKRGGA